MSRTLVLEQKEPRDQFDVRFKEMFGLTFTEWMESESTRCHAGEEIIEYEDGEIFAGMSAYCSGFRVFADPDLLTPAQPDKT